MSQPLKFHKERLFRSTEAVHFSDIGVPQSNGLDLVEHYGPAVSPPNHPSTGEKSFYRHRHQTDVNRVISGARVFELVSPSNQLEYNHYLILLTSDSGGLEIPAGVYHRSVSCNDGSILLNHAIRSAEYDEKKEFVPIMVHDDTRLLEILEKCKPKYIGGSREDIEKFLSTREFRDPYEYRSANPLNLGLFRGKITM